MYYKNASGSSGSDCGWVDNVRFTAAPSLAEALDNSSLAWSTAGHAQWMGQSLDSHDGSDAARSGLIGHNQYSQISTTATGPGTLRFYWKVSCQYNWDFLQLWLDGAKIDQILGQTDWAQKILPLAEGSHSIVWKYVKDNAFSDFEDCGWVDQVVFEPSNPGPPVLLDVADTFAGSMRLQWTNPRETPFQFLGFAYDIYAQTWVLGGWNNTLWHPFAADATQGLIPLGNAGPYHAWIGNQYSNGDYYACASPWTGLIYSGPPHTPLDVAAQDMGARRVRLTWRTDIYTTWHYQILAYKVDEGWVPISGPSGTQPWQFIMYPDAKFLNGSADFVVPKRADYWFWIRGVGWIPPHRESEYAAAFVSVSAP